jgi:hypothetical protein
LGEPDVPHPTWLAYSFAVLMVSVSVYCIGRLALAPRLGRRNHIDVTVSHVLMGAAMVGQLVPRWRVFPEGLWELIFGVLSAYFLSVSVRFVIQHGLRGIDDDHVHHLSHNLVHMVMGCAMLYMYWLGSPITTTSNTSMSMSGPPVGAGDPSLTLFLIAVLLASAVWQLDSISRFSPRALTLSAVGGGTSHNTGGGGESGGDQPWLAPRLEVGCHVAMCLTMGYMLVLMV